MSNMRALLEQAQAEVGPGLTDEQTRAWLLHGRDAVDATADEPSPADEQVDDDPPDDEPDTGLESQARLNTDIGNAARFALAKRHRLRFVPGWEKWLEWRGSHWAIDDRMAAARAAKKTALAIYAEAAREEDDGRRAKLLQWANTSQRRDRLAAMIELAKSELVVTPDELDADPWLLNVGNGTIDLHTFQLRPHRRDDYITRVCRAKYDPAATAPVFTAFLERIFRTHPALIRYVQKALGYAITGLTTEQVMFFLYGSGANGKTTLLDAIMYVLGDYAGKADRELLTATDGASHPTNIADLMGRRLVVLSETNEGRRIDEAKYKDLVGETVLKARFMRQDFFSFTATHTLFAYSNHKPLVRGTDLGFWRRMRLIPFIETIGETERDPDLPAKLRAEADGILRWLVDGCLLWQREGLGLPDEVAQATDGYRREMDSIGAFLGDCCQFGERLEASAKDLYAAYVGWCEDAGERPLSQKRLGMQLTERGLESSRCAYSRRTIWRGVGLIVSDRANEEYYKTYE